MGGNLKFPQLWRNKHVSPPPIKPSSLVIYINFEFKILKGVWNLQKGPWGIFPCMSFFIDGCQAQNFQVFFIDWISKIVNGFYFYAL